MGAGVCAGAALLPDIDEPESTIARSFGPLSWVLSQGVNKLSAAVYNVTKTSREPFVVDGHRKLTHTLAWMVLVAVATTIGCGLGGKPVTLGVLFFLIGLAMRGLMGDWVKREGWVASTAAAAAAAWAAFAFLPQGNYWWLGAAVLVGQVLHGVGDGITKEGIPWLAPMRINQKGWWEFALPSLLRIRAGGFIENAVIVPVLALAFLAGGTAQVVGWNQLLAIVGTLTQR